MWNYLDKYTPRVIVAAWLIRFALAIAGVFALGATLKLSWLAFSWGWNLLQ